MKAGAVDFFTKPFRNQDILDAVSAALQRDKERCKGEKMLAHLQAPFHALSFRDALPRVAFTGTGCGW